MAEAKTKSEKSFKSASSKRKTTKKVEPEITLTEGNPVYTVGRGFSDDTGMITSDGVEIIGMLGLVALVYGTILLYLMY